MSGTTLYTNVLVPTDHSARAARALPHAYAVVAPNGTVHLAHVLLEPLEPNPLYAHYGKTPRQPEELAKVRAAAEDELRGLVRANPPPPGVDVRLHVLVQAGGLVSDRICTLADELQADVVCIATHGRTGLRRALFGSVADGVVRRCRVPTLLVRISDRELQAD